MLRPLISVPVLGIFLMVPEFGLVKADEKPSRKKNVVIVGASSMDGLPELLEALLTANKTPMNVERGHYGPNDLKRIWASNKAWDYVIMDAWQFKRGSTDSPGFPDAVAEFVNNFRGHTPDCQIFLFPWWLPENKATNEDVMKVFHHCVDAAKPHAIRVATTGPAFQEARLARPDLRITVNKQDAHPGIHGNYINACSLLAVMTEKSPEGLPGTVKLRGHTKESTIADEDAKYLQELAWKVYQREIEFTKPQK